MFELHSVEATLAAQEARVPNLRPGCEKRIIWAGAPATATKTAVVYIHGFSATGEELRPLPDLVAEGLGANLHYTRLSGHGQNGKAMGHATLAQWQADAHEAFEVGRTIGDDVLVIGCSTGCTLATLELARGAQARGVVYISPNFGLRYRAIQALLDLPKSKRWTKLIAGHGLPLPAQNAAHAAFWTLDYPLDAVHVMGDAVRAMRDVDLSAITTPALFCFNDDDQVVHADDTRKVAARWGGPADIWPLVQTPDDHGLGHIMAGDVFSPRQTAPLAGRILTWYKALGA